MISARYSLLGTIAALILASAAYGYSLGSGTQSVIFMTTGAVIGVLFLRFFADVVRARTSWDSRERLLIVAGIAVTIVIVMGFSTFMGWASYRGWRSAASGIVVFTLFVLALIAYAYLNSVRRGDFSEGRSVPLRSGRTGGVAGEWREGEVTLSEAKARHISTDVGQVDQRVLIDQLADVGASYGFFPEREYRHDRFRYDCVWRRVWGAAPSHVFEVQVRGNRGDLIESLTKLKHASDIWNSKLFLVVSGKDLEKARELTRGSFHEISDKLEFIQVEEVTRLHASKTGIADLEKRFR